MAGKGATGTDRRGQKTRNMQMTRCTGEWFAPWCATVKDWLWQKLI